MESFRRAAADADLADNATLGTVLNGWPVALCRSGGVVHAILDRCPHAASALSTGRIRRGTIGCPLHGARFDLASGLCVGASYPPVRVFRARSLDGWIEVAVPDEPPAATADLLRAGL